MRKQRVKRARARQRSRVLVPLLVSVLAVGFLFVAVFPTRALLAQRSATGDAREQLAVIERANAELEARVEALQTDAEIERLAREQYRLVRPGEEAYAILPAPAPPVPVPDAWPFGGLAEALTNVG
ncbi:MAG: FtsB family cell division protein [Acidimicrobiales bacterium]